MHNLVKYIFVHNIHQSRKFFFDSLPIAKKLMAIYYITENYCFSRLNPRPRFRNVEAVRLANGALAVHLPERGLIAFGNASSSEILHVSYVGCTLSVRCTFKPVDPDWG